MVNSSTPPILRWILPSASNLAIGLVAALVLATGGCGSGTATALPAGVHTSQGPGNKVVYVANSMGNTVAAYQLGSDGLLPAQPFSSISLDNPRRLALGSDVLYVSLADRVVSLDLATDGSLSASPSSSSAAITGSAPLEMLVSGGILYAADSGSRKIRAYTLATGGDLPSEVLSVSGHSLSNYRTLALADGFLYAASRFSAAIDTYLISPDGSLGEFAETQVPATSVLYPEDILVNAGVLYSVDQGNERLNAYKIESNGLLPSDPTSNTTTEERYTDILLVDTHLYATAYNKGRIDLYPVDAASGALVEAPPVASTYFDTASFPAALAYDNGILYVAQAGLGRVDAYLIANNGTPTTFPSSSTLAVTGSFPTDIEIYTLP